MSSSNHAAEDFDAVVVQRSRSTGPLRLPLENPAGFIHEFNARYSSLGMSVRLLHDEIRPPNEESPATSD